MSKFLLLICNSSGHFPLLKIMFFLQSYWQIVNLHFFTVYSSNSVSSILQWLNICLMGVLSPFWKTAFLSFLLMSNPSAGFSPQLWSGSRLTSQTANLIFLQKKSCFSSNVIKIFASFHVRMFYFFNKIPPKYINLLSHYLFHKFVIGLPKSLWTYRNLLSFADPLIISIFLRWKFYFPI